MLDHVAAPNVEDDGDLRLQRDDVREVLLGSDAEVHTARLEGLFQPRNHRLKTRLVGKQVVGAEVSTRLRKLGVQLPKLLVGEPRRNRALGERENRKRREREDAERGSTGAKH